MTAEMGTKHAKRSSKSRPLVPLNLIVFASHARLALVARYSLLKTERNGLVTDELAKVGVFANPGSTSDHGFREEPATKVSKRSPKARDANTAMPSRLPRLFTRDRKKCLVKERPTVISMLRIVTARTSPAEHAVRTLSGLDERTPNIFPAATPVQGDDHNGLSE